MQLIPVVGGKLFCHTIHRAVPGKRGRIGVRRTVNAHDIGAGGQTLHRRDKVLHHGVFTVGIILLIGVTL